jgi:hypothetical protein
MFQAKDQLSGLGSPFDSDHSARSGDVSQLFSVAIPIFRHLLSFRRTCRVVRPSRLIAAVDSGAELRG